MTKEEIIKERDSFAKKKKRSQTSPFFPFFLASGEET